MGFITKIMHFQASAAKNLRNLFIIMPLYLNVAFKYLCRLTISNLIQVSGGSDGPERVGG